MVIFNHSVSIIDERKMHWSFSTEFWMKSYCLGCQPNIYNPKVRGPKPRSGGWREPVQCIAVWFDVALCAEQGQFRNCWFWKRAVSPTSKNSCVKVLDEQVDGYKNVRTLRGLTFVSCLVQISYEVVFSTLQSTFSLVFGYLTMGCWFIITSVYCRLVFAVCLHYTMNWEPGVLLTGIHLYGLWGPYITEDDCRQ